MNRHLYPHFNGGPQRDPRPLALMAAEEHLKNAGYIGVSASQVRDYTSYIIGKFHDLQAVETARADEAQPSPVDQKTEIVSTR